MTDTATDAATHEKPKDLIVHDGHGHPYRLTGKLGQGGQGVVYRTTSNNVLVKISTHITEAQRADWINHIRWIMRLPLEGLAIARPVAVVERPRPGYVMELMDGLLPLSELLDLSESSMLEGADPTEKLSGFLKTGGLKRRVNLLGRLARLLADLHGRGLAFGDLSPSNVFVSQACEHAEVWLIDCDNLCFSSRSSKDSMITPDYGAPEIMRKESGVNTLTDIYSFAVIAFRLLALSHPLKGDIVNDGGPEVEEAALRGALPWVDHPTDRRNEMTTGLPREIVLTERLRDLFSQCFGEGLASPGARPSMAAWAAAFEAASALTILCEGPDCGNHFFAEKSLQCPFCDNRNSPENHLILTHRLYAPEWCDPDEELDSGVWVKTGDYVVLSLDSPLELRRSPVGTSLYSQSDPLLSIELTRTGLKLTPCDGCDVSINRVDGGEPFAITRAQRLKSESRRGERWVLHLGGRDSGHPTWTFKW